MRHSLTAAVVVFLAMASMAAAADVIPPPPVDCIDGTTPVSGHGGAACLPKVCLPDRACPAGTVCRELPLCVGQVTGGGRRPRNAPPPVPRPTVIGRCAKADGSACSLPPHATPRLGVTSGKCQAIKLCVAGGAGPTGTGGAGRK